MAADKFFIPNIQIGEHSVPGKAYGGLIHSIRATIGKDAEPSSIQLSIGMDTATDLNESGRKRRDFAIDKSFLNLQDPLTIKWGVDEKGKGGEVLFSNVFLNSFNKNTTPGGKTLSVEFMDGAVLLDRIFVGSLHEHVDSQGPGIGSHTYGVEMKAKCPKRTPREINSAGDTIIVCDHNNIETVTRTAKRNLLSVNPNIRGFDSIARPVGSGPKDIWKGGYILVGKEEFTEQSCALSDVSYNIHDLINAVRKFGIAVDVLSFTKGDVILPRNYTGTLRDVLQNWSNDLGFHISWDFSAKQPRLVITRGGDIQQVEERIEQVRRYIEKEDAKGAEKSGLVLADFNEAFSLNGTYSQGYCSTWNIGPNARTSQNKSITNTVFVCEDLDTVGGKSGLYNGRSKEDIYRSCLLGKYSKELRDIYNLRRGIAVIAEIMDAVVEPDPNKRPKARFEAYIKEENIKKYMPYFEALGMRSMFPITFGPLHQSPHGQKLKDNIWNFEEGISKHLMDTVGYVTEKVKVGPDGKAPKKVHFFLGFYDQKLKDYTVQLESEIANNYIGKHYTLQAPFSEIFDDSQCPYQKVLETLKTNPDGQYYAASEFYKSPIAKFIEKIEDLQMSFDKDSYKNVLFDKLGDMKRDIKAVCDQDIIRKAKETGFFYFNRSDAAWATFQEDIKNLLNPWTLVLNDRWANGIDNVSQKDEYRSETVSRRVKKNILNLYTPVMHPTTCVQSFFSKLETDGEEDDTITAENKMSKDLRDFFAREILNQGKGSAEKPMLVFHKTEEDQTVPVDTIGDITLNFGEYKEVVTEVEGETVREKKFFGRRVRNPIEELNALKAYCDKINGVYEERINNCSGTGGTSGTSGVGGVGTSGIAGSTVGAGAHGAIGTLCEQDLIETICGNCGEMEKLADANHHIGIIPDKQGHIKTRAIEIIRRHNEQKVYTGTATNQDTGKKEDAHTMESLYSNTLHFIGNSAENHEKFRRVDIIAPSESKHGATLTYTKDKTSTDMGTRKVFDGINGDVSRLVLPSKTSSELKYMTQDISQVILSGYNEDVGVVDGELPLMLMVDIIIDKSDVTRLRKLQNMAAGRYHNLIRAHLFDKSSDDPKGTYTFKLYLGGVNALKELNKYLNIYYGLADLSINQDSSGLAVDLTFSNSPPKKPEFEALYRKIGPLVKSHSHRLATLSSL
jgi:hypothetical protein|tara:strand:- start:245 stop:3793 length:3549 start_codon:yes stop_codon:yes gene_type:complete